MNPDPNPSHSDPNPNPNLNKIAKKDQPHFKDKYVFIKINKIFDTVVDNFFFNK